MKTAVATATPVVKRAAANAESAARDAAERYGPVVQDAARRAATNAAQAATAAGFSSGMPASDMGYGGGREYGGADSPTFGAKIGDSSFPPASSSATAGGSFWDSLPAREQGSSRPQSQPPQRLVDMMVQEQMGAAAAASRPSVPRPNMAAQPPTPQPYEAAQKDAMRNFKAGRYEEAERLFRHALTLCPADDPQLAVVYNNLAATLEKRLMPREAEALYLQAIAICEEKLEPGHTRTKHIKQKLDALRSTLMAFPGLPSEVAAAGTARTVAMVAPAGDDFVSE